MSDDGASIFEPADPVRIIDHRRSGRARYWAARLKFRNRPNRAKRRVIYARYTR